VWDDFCAWYLEMVKPEFVEGNSLPIDASTYKATISNFEKLLKVVHPLMPFISEELWHLLDEDRSSDCIIIAKWPVQNKVDSKLLASFTIASEVITQIRNIRVQKNISPKEQMSLFVKSGDKVDDRFNGMVLKLANIDKFENTLEKIENASSFMIGHNEFYIPMSNNFDVAAEKERLNKELDYNTGFLKSVQSKLANERFVSNAKPEIVENEMKKKADAEAKIKAIEEQLAGLK